jgi:ABC-2 type transport system permease protein
MMNGDERKPQTFSWVRRWGAGLNLVITLAAVLALVVMVNYLAVRHYTRFHWNQGTEGGLSKHTRNVLGALTNTVKIITYYDSQDPLFPRVQALLKEYEYASPHIKVQLVDYIRDGATAKLIKQQYGLNAVSDKNLVLFDMNGRTRTAYEGELSEYDTTKLVQGITNEVERSHFKGELVFTSKIFAVANERSPIAYFLIGHGEHIPYDDKSQEGYGKFALMLTNENNFELRLLTLGGTNEVPANCNLLIIGGAWNPFDRTELDAIQRYLEQGGRMLVTCNSLTVHNRRPSGLEKLLARWGVDLGENVIVDQENSPSGGWDVVPVFMGKHPVVNPLPNSKLLLYMPRSVSALPAAWRPGDVSVEELLFTGPEAVVVTDPARQEVDRTQRGARPLMVAVEKSVPALQRGSTRIAVIGDSWMFNNGLIEAGANRQFAALTANWLVSQAVLLSDIRPQAIHTYQLTMTQGQLRSVQLVLLLGMPGVVLLAGLVVWVRRRH